MPGVGHFGQASRTLASTGLGPAVRDARGGRSRGDGHLPGTAALLRHERGGAGGAAAWGSSRDASGPLRRPACPCRTSDGRGWSRRRRAPAIPWWRAVFRGQPQFFYHVHSYHPAGARRRTTCWPPGRTSAVFPTIVGRGNVLGAQFHPEKSQRAGIELLDAFARWRP